MSHPIALLSALVPEIVEAASGRDRGSPLRYLCEQAVELLDLRGADIVTPADEGATDDGDHANADTDGAYGAASVEARAGDHRVAGALSHMQLDEGEGPCVEALTGRHNVLERRVTGRGPQRWPAFVRAAADADVEAVYSLYLGTSRRVLGVLNLYARGEGRLDDHERAVADVLAGYAAVCRVYRDQLDDADLLTAQLQQALADRSFVEQALRRIARARRTSYDDAAVYLSRRSRDLRLAEHEVARQMVLADTDMPDSVDTPTANEAPTGVLLLDRHASFREALGRVLLHESDLSVTAEVASVEEAVAAAERTAPAVAVVCLEASGDPGDDDAVGAVEALREAVPDTRVVAVTSTEDHAAWGAAVRGGAITALSKQASLEHLLDVVRRVAAGRDVATAGDVAQWLRAVSDAHEQRWYARMLDQRITTREREVLQALAAGADTSQIAAQLMVSPATVQTHVRNLLGKFQARSRLEMVVEAMRLELVALPSRSSTTPELPQIG